MSIPITYKYLGQQPSLDVLVQLQDTTNGNIVSPNYHPLFNFPPQFSSLMQNLGSLELAESVPFISLTLLNQSREPITNLNISFFNKIYDLQKLSQGIRYGDRPDISLKDMVIEITEGSGIISFTKVTLNFKVHSPDQITNTSLQSMLYSGAPIKIEYGWNNSRASSFLNLKEQLLMNVSTYDINYDATGQIDLSVTGFAYNDLFNNILIGDSSEFDFSNEAILQKNVKYNGVGSTKNIIDQLTNDMNQLQRNVGTIRGTVIKNQNTPLADMEQKARKIISTNLTQRVQSLHPQTSNPYRINGMKVISFHELFSTLVGTTISSVGEVFSNITSVEIIYGTFNSKAGLWHDKSIADFAVPYDKIHQFFVRAIRNGSLVPTIGKLVDYIGDFFNDEKYYTRSQPTNNNVREDEESFQLPQVVCHLQNRGDGILEIDIIDVKYNIPVTTTLIRDQNQTQQQFEDAVATQNNLTIVKLGHANSFIKNASLSNNVDQFLKAVKINDLNNSRIDSVRNATVKSKNKSDSKAAPLLFPIRGKLSVLGHPQWKPYRFFYLSTGIYFLSGVYKIMALTHRLSSEGFTTDLDIMYN